MLACTYLLGQQFCILLQINHSKNYSSYSKNKKITDTGMLTVYSSKNWCNGRHYFKIMHNVKLNECKNPLQWGKF